MTKDKASDDMIFGVSFFLAVTVHAWILAALFNYFPPPTWTVLPILMTALITLVLMGSFFAYWLRIWDENERSSDAASEPLK